MFVLNSNKFDGKIFVKNSPVQGNDCPTGICKGIKYFNDFKYNNNPVDLIMITRGGGDIDDLMGFSSPLVIEEIYKSDIFIMSAVGHEVDNMLSDFVADIRAPTPSIGAEMICKATVNKTNQIELYRDKISNYNNIIKIKLENVRRNFNATKKKMYLNIYDQNKTRLKLIEDGVNSILHNKLSSIKQDLNNIKSNIDLIKNSEYNAVLIKNNKPIKSIDDIKDGVYYIKIAGKLKKIDIKNHE